MGCFARFWLGALFASGCATAGGDGASMSAKGMYAVAEDHYANEDFPAAAAMMRHAIVNLPETKDHDGLRHQLILRMAHTQLRAFHASGDAAFLIDAQAMLDRYVVKHEELFGTGKQAKAARGECYELLYEVESRLDAVAATPRDEVAVAPSPADARVADVGDGAATTDARTAMVHEDEPAAAGETPREAAPTLADASGNGEIQVIDGAVHREVRVPNRKRPDVNDPRIRAVLRSDFSLPEAGPVLTRGGGIVVLHGPRPLVRMSGLARAAAGRPSFAESTALAHRFVASARVELRACYDRAFARRPVDATEATIELTVDEEGRVHKPRIVDGRVVDGIGDVCVLEVAALARVPSPPKDAVRVRVPLVFFYEGEKTIREPIVGTTNASFEMPRIDAAPRPGGRLQ